VRTASRIPVANDQFVAWGTRSADRVPLFRVSTWQVSHHV